MLVADGYVLSSRVNVLSRLVSLQSAVSESRLLTALQTEKAFAYTLSQ